jgi:hypothetical protein
MAMVGAEQSSKSFTSADASNGGGYDALGPRRKDEEAVADTLVTALGVVVLDVFGNESSDVPLTERDDASDTLPTGGLGLGFPRGA